MGKPDDGADRDLPESSIPVWVTTLGTLLVLTACASWLTTTRSSVQDAVFQARLRDALALEAQARLPEAILEFRHAVEIRPDNFAARLGLSRTLGLSRRWTEAEQHLLQLLTEQPNSGVVHLLLAGPVWPGRTHPPPATTIPARFTATGTQRS